MKRARSFHLVWALVACALIAASTVAVRIIIEPASDRTAMERDERRLGDGAPAEADATDQGEIPQRQERRATCVVSVISTRETVDPSEVLVVLSRMPGDLPVAESRRSGAEWTFSDLAPGGYRLTYDDGSGPLPASPVDLGPGQSEHVRLDVTGRARLSLSVR